MPLLTIQQYSPKKKKKTNLSNCSTFVGIFEYFEKIHEILRNFSVSGTFPGKKVSLMRRDCYLYMQIPIAIGHPDHSGNTNDFPDAYHFAGKFMYRRMNFKFSRVFKVVHSTSF